MTYYPDHRHPATCAGREVVPDYGTMAQPVNTSDATGSPARQGARPDGQDLNPVSVKDLSASASPATKEQQ